MDDEEWEEMALHSYGRIGEEQAGYNPNIQKQPYRNNQTVRQDGMITEADFPAIITSSHRGTRYLNVYVDGVFVEGAVTLIDVERGLVYGLEGDLIDDEFILRRSGLGGGDVIPFRKEGVVTVRDKRMLRDRTSPENAE